VLLGALMAYQILMSDCLYHSVKAMFSLQQSGFWTQQIPPVFILFALFPLCCLKRLTLLVKINTYGILAVGIIFFFIVYASIDLGVSFDHVPQFDPDFPALAGVLTVSFFIHNCVLPIMKNQRYPEHNNRDLAIAFVLVGLTYATIGSLGYLAFTSHGLPIPADFLNHFSENDKGAMVARIALFLQLFTVFPLIVYITRLQLFGYVFGTDYPSVVHVVALNVAIFLATTMIAVFYPSLVDVLRYTGAVCGLIYIFILPVAVHMRASRQSGKPLDRIENLHYVLPVIGLALLIGQFLV